jgi:hypothetical protein
MQMQGLGVSTQHTEWGMLTQCAEAGGINPAPRGQGHWCRAGCWCRTQEVQLECLNTDSLLGQGGWWQVEPTRIWSDCEWGGHAFSHMVVTNYMHVWLSKFAFHSQQTSIVFGYKHIEQLRLSITKLLEPLMEKWRRQRMHRTLTYKKKEVIILIFGVCTVFCPIEWCCPIGVTSLCLRHQRSLAHTWWHG